MSARTIALCWMVVAFAFSPFGNRIQELFDPSSTSAQANWVVEPNLAQANLQQTEFCDSVTQIPTAECEALEALYNSTNGPGWTNRTGWLGTTTPCSWYGVTCAGGFITRLFLGDNHLSGSIPPEIGDLVHLLEFGLPENQLTGSIPPEIGGLDNLEYLFLFKNQLSGSIPSQMGDMAMLKHLGLDYNQISGGIPPEIGNLANLEKLKLVYNQLTGSIPPEIGSLIGLEELTLHHNLLTGSLPAALWTLPNLDYLDLSNNQFSGSLPPQIGNLARLTNLRISYTLLSGEIPPELGNLANLRTLDLAHNQFSGAIPPQLGSLTSLIWMDLQYNHFTGNLPPELGSLTNLTNLRLQNNQLSGSFPSGVGGLTKLTGLEIAFNAFTGEVPASITALTGLTWLDVGHNALYTTNPTTLAFLNLKDPDWAVTQTVPPGNLAVSSAACDQVTLTWSPILFQDYNGYYQVEVANLPEGPYTNAGNTASKSVNTFTVSGLAPQTPYYFRVRTYSWAFSPEQHELWSEYVYTALGEGQPPIEPHLPIQECLALAALYQNTGGYQWINHTGWMVDYDPCAWHGVTCAGGHITELDLRNNQLMGYIPEALSDLSNLEVLRLGGNRFETNIQSELGRLINLKHLDLSNNALWWEVPDSFTALTKLETLDLSFNRLLATNPSTVAFLNSISPGWSSTQTLPPSNQDITDVGPTWVTLSWTPILYTADGGYYEVEIATNPVFFSQAGITTSKTTNGYTVTGLTPQTTYYFRIRSFTPAHGEQHNDLWSHYSFQHMVTTGTVMDIPGSLFLPLVVR